MGNWPSTSQVSLHCQLAQKKQTAMNPRALRRLNSANKRLGTPSFPWIPQGEPSPGQPLDRSLVRDSGRRASSAARTTDPQKLADNVCAASPLLECGHLWGSHRKPIQWVWTGAWDQRCPLWIAAVLLWHLSCPPFGVTFQVALASIRLQNSLNSNHIHQDSQDIFGEHLRTGYIWSWSIDFLVSVIQTLAFFLNLLHIKTP